MTIENVSNELEITDLEATYAIGLVSAGAGDLRFEPGPKAGAALISRIDADGVLVGNSPLVKVTYWRGWL